MSFAAKRIKLGRENQNIWEIGECCHCNRLLENNSKLLMCLHGICKECSVTKKLDLGVPCNICKTVTEEKLLDYPAAAIKFKTCSNLLCYKESRVKCVLCWETFCNSCSLEHKNIDEKHKRAVDEDNENIFENLKNNFDRCPNCCNRTVEVMCTNCSTVQCALCQLKHHEGHTYKSLEILTKETKAKFNLERNHLELNTARIDQCISLTLAQNQELKEKYCASKTQVVKLVERISKEIQFRGRELLLCIDERYKEQSSMINKNKKTLESLKKKNEYYSIFTSSILDHNTCLYDTELTKIITDKLTTVKTCITSDTPQLVSKMKPNFTFNYIDTFNAIMQNIKSVGITSSSNIVDLSNIVDQEMSLSKIEAQSSIENCPVEGQSSKEAAENNSLSRILNDNTQLVDERTSSNNLSNNSHKSAFQTGHVDMAYSEDENIRSKLCKCCSVKVCDAIAGSSVGGENPNHDTENSVSKSCAYCSIILCNNSSDKYNCSNCCRSYHSTCHVPQLPINVTDAGTFTIMPWCTLCRKIVRITVEPITRDRDICARLLMELLFTNEYKVHFKYASQEKYSTDGQLISVNLSLIKFKKRFESEAYRPRVLSFIDELKEVFSNAVLLFTFPNRYHMSAIVLQQTLNDMVNKWIHVPANPSPQVSE